MKFTFLMFTLLCVTSAAYAQQNLTPPVGIGIASPATPLEINTTIDFAGTGSEYAAALDLGYTFDYGSGNPLQYLLLYPQYNGTLGESAAGMSGILRDYRGHNFTFNSPLEHTIVGQTAYGNSYINILPRSNVSGLPTVYSVTYNGVPYLALRGSDLCGSGGHLTFTGYFWNDINGAKPQLVLASALTNISVFLQSSAFFPGVITVTTAANVGIGQSTPQEPLHVLGEASTVDANADFTGVVGIQASLTGRSSATSGAALEFILPADSADGSNLWAQARILALPGNNRNRDATGKLVMGTRRWLNKDNLGFGWYYGNDLTIDSVGDVGIGTLHPQSMLAVAGTVTAKQVTVTATGWSDFVFAPGYVLPSLDSVAAYTQRYSHLPGVPSATDVARDGQDLGAMNKVLLQKVEELTQYAIEAERHARAQDSVIAELQAKVGALSRRH